MTERPKTLGYVVEVRHGGALYTSRATGDVGGVLWVGRHATVFPTRAAAQQAINRTLAFAVANDIAWKASEYTVKRVCHA